MAGMQDIAAVRDLLEPKEELVSAPVENVPEELLIDAEEEAEAPTLTVSDEEGNVEVVDEAEGDVPESYTVSSFAEATGLEQSDIYDVLVPLDGEQEPVPLGTLKNEYQNSVREKQALEAQLAEAQQKAESVQGVVGAGQQVSDEVIEAMAQHQALVSRYESIDWAKAEQEDPGQAALLKQKYNEAFGQAGQQVQAAKQKQVEMQQQGLQMAHQRMMELFPEWKDPAVMNADHETIRQSMRANGYDEATINGVSDPNALRVFLKLARLEQAQEQASEAVQKVRKAPKVLKGHGKFAKKGVDMKKLTSAVANAPRGGRKKAEFAAVKELLNNRV